MGKAPGYGKVYSGTKLHDQFKRLAASMDRRDFGDDLQRDVVAVETFREIYAWADMPKTEKYLKKTLQKQIVMARDLWICYWIY